MKNWFKKKQTEVIQPKFKIVTKIQRVNLGKVLLEFYTKSGEIYKKEYCGKLQTFKNYADINTGRIYYSHDDESKFFKEYYMDCYLLNKMTVQDALNEQRHMRKIQFEVVVNVKNFMTMVRQTVEIDVNEIKKIVATEFDLQQSVSVSELEKL